MTKLLPDGTMQGEACDRLESVADRLEAWAEAANNLVDGARRVDPERARIHENHRENYTILAQTIREAVRDINARGGKSHG